MTVHPADGKSFRVNPVIQQSILQEIPMSSKRGPSSQAEVQDAEAGRRCVSLSREAQELQYVSSLTVSV